MRRFLPFLLVPLAAAVAGAELVDSGLSYLDAAGDWRVYLRTHVVVAGDSPSAAGTRTVRFANDAAQWNAALGANLLGTVRVADPATGDR